MFQNFKNEYVILSILKRKRFLPIVRMHYCIPAQTFLGVPDRFMNVYERFISVYNILSRLYDKKI